MGARVIETLAPVEHPIILRGGAAEVWNHIGRAIDDGIEPPPEIMLKGVAGSGKSFGGLGALLCVAQLFPQLPGRVLVIRLTRKSLTTSACVTIRKILHPAHPALQGANDGHRDGYNIGKWFFGLGTLDNIDNYLSAEWDFVFLDEARQAELEQWELLAGRGVRNNVFFHYDIDGNRVPKERRGIDSVSKIPFGICIGATNPWKRKSWFNTRAEAGVLTMYRSKLEENPGYADLNKAGVLTLNIEGKSYRARMERTNSGTRYRRLVLGEDCSAEGMIYEEWKDEPIAQWREEPGSRAEGDRIRAADTNLIRLPRDAEGWVTLETCKALDIREFYACVDFGDAAPGCFWIFGFTGKRERIFLCEAYARKKDPRWWADRIVEAHRHYKITLGFCDHRIDMINLFNDSVGADREGPGAIFVQTKKGPGSVDRNIGIMRMGIRERRIKYDVDALMHPPDPLCIEDGIPWQTTDEMDGYVHKRKDDEDQPSSDKREDVPDPKCHDHGINACQYGCHGTEYMNPEKKLREPVSVERANYLKGLYSLPVAGIEDENALDLDAEQMQDEEADYLQELKDSFHRAPGDDE